MKLSVIALGGNALMHKGEGTAEQFRNAARTAALVAPLSITRRIVLTHGNGPQVGNIMIRAHEALGKAYDIPLYIGVAESEGEIGYVIQQSLLNEFSRHNMKKSVASVITQVLVNSEDKAFRKPTKPIGPYYRKKEADAMRKKGVKMIYDTRGGYRQAVASPEPIRIIEADVVRKLSGNGIVVIAAGGGGVPVVKKKGKLIGVNAVIDKDLASLCLAKSIGADEFIMLTDVECAYLNYGRKTQKPLRNVNCKQAEKYLKQGQFGEGSMAPKIRAAIGFARAGGRAIITSPGMLKKALEGKAGTIIEK